jgi:hypothetical protein
MRYALLVYGEPGAALRERLAPVDTATTVRVHDGDLVVIDGPFAEGETLGGVVLIDADSLDEAIERAEGLAGDGSVEIRPVVDR